MKILVMADVIANPDSGAAGTEYQTVEALRRLGHSVDTVWADSLPHRIAHGNLHYLVELPFAYRTVMLERMQSAHYDVIHVNQPHGYLAAKALIGRRERTVFVHRSHGLELRVSRELGEWYQKFNIKDTRPWSKRQASRVIAALLVRHSLAIAKYADGHIVSSTDCSRFMIEELGVSAERVAVIPQAGPPAYVTTPAPAMTTERQTRLLYVGQYAFVKAPMIVAEVINQIAEVNNTIRATWVTSKTAHSQVYAMLSAVAKKRTMLLDWMPQEQLIDVYDSHGIFLFPSFFEGFGKAFLEAMSRGLCVVASDNGGARDVVNHHRNGFLVPTGDISQMTQICLDLLKSIGRAQAVSQQAALRAREYTWDRVARETTAFYERLQKASREGPTRA